jgi:DNA-nicking Smr family endonuclease
MADNSDPPDNDDDDDSDLFRQMMRDVTPLPEDDRIEPPAATSPARLHNREASDVTDTGSNSFIQSDYISPVRPEEALFFAGPGLQEKLRKRLRRGQIPVEARLDLHGKTINQAGQQLDGFLQHAQSEGLRCVLVIHGRGHRSQDNQPVLKAQVNHWLREYPGVLAFASATPQHGGVGALYVLLKKAT